MENRPVGKMKKICIGCGIAFEQEHLPFHVCKGGITTKTKPQNKQETSEWLVEKVLGFIFQGIGWTRTVEKPYDSTSIGILYKTQLASKGHLTPEQFIYSPAGFFAVWDAVEKKLSQSETWGIISCGIARYTFWNPKPDRYEAFYNAVYDAMKEDKDVT